MYDLLSYMVCVRLYGMFHIMRYMMDCMSYCVVVCYVLGYVLYVTYMLRITTNAIRCVFRYMEFGRLYVAW